MRECSQLIERVWKHLFLSEHCLYIYLRICHVIVDKRGINLEVSYLYSKHRQTKAEVMVKGSLFEKRAVQIQKEDSLSSKEKNLQKI